jgi:hypothetical protein
MNFASGSFDRSNRVALLACLCLGNVTLSACSNKEMPPDELVFARIISHWREAYSEARNDFQREPMRAARGSELCQKVNPTVNQWSGTVHKIFATSDNEAYIQIRISTHARLGPELISRDVRLFQSVKNLGDGDRVVVSGRFIRVVDNPKYANKADCFRESSLTEGGSLDDPEYDFLFSEIRAR